MDIETLADGRNEYTVILWHVKYTSRMFYPRADSLNGAIRKAIAFQGDGWEPLFAWCGRHEPDYSLYGENQMDYLFDKEGK